MDSVLKLILSYFFENMQELSVPSGMERFTKVFEYIDSHINEKIHIKDLSALVYMDDAYFQTCSKKHSASHCKNIFSKRKPIRRGICFPPT